MLEGKWEKRQVIKVMEKIICRFSWAYTRVYINVRLTQGRKTCSIISILCLRPTKRVYVNSFLRTFFERKALPICLDLQILHSIFQCRKELTELLVKWLTLTDQIHPQCSGIDESETEAMDASQPKLHDVRYKCNDKRF